MNLNQIGAIGFVLAFVARASSTRRSRSRGSARVAVSRPRPRASRRARAVYSSRVARRDLPPPDLR